MFIAIDIGGTNTRIGASKDGRRFFTIEKFRTPKKFADGVTMIKRTVLWLAKGQSFIRPHKIAIAIPSSVNHGRARHLPNLPGWGRNISVERLSRTLGYPVALLVNDANAAGIGEAHRGANRSYHKILYLTLSTGIGGARLINGRIDPRAPNFEPGHYTLVQNGRKCGCGRRGCFEAYGSGAAFYKTYGVRPEYCKNKKIWAKHAQTVGWGLLNTIVHWSPDVVVIGGGLSQAGPLLFKPLRAYVRQHLKILKPPLLLPAKLGDNAGLYGCLKLLS